MVLEFWVGIRQGLTKSHGKVKHDLALAGNRLEMVSR